MRNGINNNFGSKGKNLILLNHFALLIIIIFVFCISITEERHRNIINFSSEINLIITGNGKQSLLNSSFTFQPSQVLVEGNLRDDCKIFCELEKDENNIKLIFNNIVPTTHSMFNGLDNIKEIDLSSFDFSNVKSMANMFSECENLEKIHFGNINT